MRRVAVLLILTCCFVSTATAQVHVDHEDMTLIRSVPPRYPLEAREIRLQGVVVMDIVIDVEGRASDVRIIAGHPFFRQPALDAVEQWRYLPHTVDGEPVEVVTIVEVTFTLS